MRRNNPRGKRPQLPPHTKAASDRPRPPAKRDRAPALEPRPDRPGSSEKQVPGKEGERLQKILAGAGISSRRAAEELIRSGRVTLNGDVVTEMGLRAVAGRDTVSLDGTPVPFAPGPGKAGHAFVYIALNKPPGVVSTAKDTHGRRTVLDLLHDDVRVGKDSPRLEKGAMPRVYPVGRLDAETTGLILLTNDGDLTFRLTHPRFGVDKEYNALVRGKPAIAELNKLRQGIDIEGEATAPAEVSEIGMRGADSLLRIIIHEGRKRQVRLMCQAIGHPAMELERVRFGPLTLGDLPRGRWRYLAVHEVHALRKAVKLRQASAAEHRERPAAAKPKTKLQRGARTNATGEARRPAPVNRDRRPGGSGKEHNRPSARR